jgi:TolB-like protein
MENNAMSKTLMKKWWGLALVWMLVVEWPADLAHAAAPEARMNVAVVEFSVMGDMHEQAGAIMADLMMSALANSGRFTLKDRLSLSAVSKIAKAQDQELGYTGLLDPRTAADLGQRYSLDAVVIGAVSKPGDLITVTARLIDTKTASLLRSGQIQGKDIDTIQVQVNELAAMIAAPPEPPRAYGLTVRTEPGSAGVRLLNSPLPYQPGVRLPPGGYEIEVSQSGYTARRESVNVVDRDVAITVVLDKAKYSLTVRTEPADAQIRLLDASTPYRPGVELAPGHYEIEVVKEGYVSRKFPVRIIDSALTVPVALEKQPPPPAQYRLTVQTDPPEATVRLSNIKTPYRPGVALASGAYTVDVSQPGYDSQRVTINIVNSDVTVPVKLVKSLPPASYRLTVRPDPSSARIRLLGVRATYKPGVELAPGNYTIEVSQSGYESKRVTVRIADSDVTVPVALTKQQQYRLTVRADPADAQVRLLDLRTAYRPGVELAPGNYTIEVSQPGYESKRVTVRIADSDVTVPVALIPDAPVKPTQYRLTIRTDPASARVRLVNSSFTYRPGVSLPPGNYTIEVSGRGYETQRSSVRIDDRDVTESVVLEQIAQTPAPPPPPPPPGWRIGSVQVDGSISGADRSEVQRVLSRYAGQTATRDSLLNSALQVYRSTGITLNFTVRNAASGSAELQARVSQRLRQTYQSSVPLITRGEIEKSGFRVSVE